MAEKIVTFREMEHKAYLKDVFTVLFVAACGMPVAQALFSVPVNVLFGGIEEMTPWLCVLKTAVTMLYNGIGFLLPFLLFQMLKYRTPGRWFVRAEEKTGASVCVLGALASVCLGAACFVASAAVSDILTAQGYILTERYVPTVISGELVTYIAYVILSAVIPTVFYEIAFRGIVMNHIAGEHTGFAVVISALLCAGSGVSLLTFFVLLVTGFVLGYLYVKTHNRTLTAFACGMTSAVTAGLWVWRELDTDGYSAAAGTLAVVFAVIGCASAVLLFVILQKKKQENKLTLRDGCKAFFGSFAMWIYLLLVVFIFFFLCLSKPKPQEKENVPSDGTVTSEGVGEE